MSAFPVTNLQEPIDRRKLLLQKLMEQFQAMLPVRAQPDVSGGHPFKGAGDMPQAARPGLTHGQNVMQSVLDRLGVTGHGPNVGEYSPALGQSIAPVSGDHRGTPGPPISGYSPAPGGLTPVPAPAPATHLHDLSDDEAPAFGGLTGPVPIGGGLYFDPDSGQIIGQPAPSIGAAPRYLYGQVE